MNIEDWRQDYVKFLSRFPWLWFCTLTFRPGLSIFQARWRLRTWMRELKLALGTGNFAWFAVREDGKTGMDLHFHSLVMGLTDRGAEQRVEWMRAWEKLAGDALITPFNPDAGGLAYILKNVNPDDPDAIDFEMNGETQMQTEFEEVGKAATTMDVDGSCPNSKGEAMNAVKKGNKLVIELTLQSPKLSATGKTLVVATTRGPWESPVEIDGKPLKILCNAYIDSAPADTADDEEEVVSQRKAKARR